MNGYYQALAEALLAGGSVLTATAWSGPDDAPEIHRALWSGGELTCAGPADKAFFQDALERLPAEPVFPRREEAAGRPVLFERICARQKLYICGGGHIAAPLAAIGDMLGFDVTVIDDRPEFVTAARFPSAKERICAPFAEAMPNLEYTDAGYFVIVTRGHQHDRACLEEILNRRFGYAGMIGSRRKVAVVMENLAEQGYPKELLDRVHAPIGLRIGAQTPAEIAVCIAAEIIQERSGNAGGEFDRKGLEQLVSGEPAVLATILEKSGSAPRGVGARLLLTESGKLFGTIGGGTAEAETIAAAKELFGKGARIQRFSMTNADARQAGMVCGGTVTVLLEPV